MRSSCLVISFFEYSRSLIVLHDIEASLWSTSYHVFTSLETHRAQEFVLIFKSLISFVLMVCYTCECSLQDDITDAGERGVSYQGSVVE